jgi:hypothetical protein
VTFLGASVRPLAAAVIAREYEQHLRVWELRARYLMAADQVRAGEALLEAVAEIREAGRQRLGESPGTSGVGNAEVPMVDADARSEHLLGPGLSTRQVAKSIELSIRQVRNLCKPGGPLLATLDQGVWRIDEVSVAEYLESRRSA